MEIDAKVEDKIEEKKDFIDEDKNGIDDREEAKIKAGSKFCWSKVWVGVFKVLTWLGTYAYGVYTWKIINVIDKVLASNGHSVELANSPMIIFLVGGWVVATVCVVLNLQKAIGTSIEKAEIKINAEAKLGKTINTDSASVLDKVFNRKKDKED